MIGFNFLVFFLLIFSFGRDFKKDLGKNRKAKFFQILLLGLFILNYASYFLELAEVVRNFDWTISIYNQSIGFLPGPFYVALYFTQLFLVLFLVQFALRMINRSIGAKRWFLRLIPWFAILSVFTIYRNWWVFRNEDFGNDLLIYGTEALLVVVFSISCLKVYSSTWMRAYFGEPISHSKIESQ